jgi:hypothetical protein
MNPKSKTMSITGLPLMVQVPVTTASVSPVRRWSRNKRRVYDSRDENESGSRETMERFISSKLSGSASDVIRSLADML